ncbi:unnamed protein product [Pieris brassicae]|uniref:Uncharacterized protein n=1 Tax=Pieris brassicae TaxID=7116 RepID=A0A9P0TAA9_PIEBR|nr:unnamed protein product [Pieris brassicae]
MNIKDWREMRAPPPPRTRDTPEPLITYTKYLRRASSRSPRANSSRPLYRRPASPAVIKLASPLKPRPVCGERGNSERGAPRPFAQCAGDR